MDWVEHNKKEFGVQIQELQKIIESQVLATGNSDEFTSDMLVALKTGRKITPKMEAAIDKIIRVNSPDEMLKRQEWVDRVVPKLMMVSNLISFYTDTNGTPQQALELITGSISIPFCVKIIKSYLMF